MANSYQSVILATLFLGKPLSYMLHNAHAFNHKLTNALLESVSGNKKNDRRSIFGTFTQNKDVMTSNKFLKYMFI